MAIAIAATKYVLDGAINVNPNNTGEPAIVPTLDSVEEAQVQTANFSSEFGRGNGSVVNLRTKSGTNQIHGRIWEYGRNSSLNARNFFAASRQPLSYNQFGGNVGGPIIKNKTFYFFSYEGTRNALGTAQVFQVETPEYRNYVAQTNPNGIAASLLAKYPAPTPLAGSNGRRYADQVDLVTKLGTIPALGRASVTLKDYIRFDQAMGKVDHAFHDGRDKITARWISEWQRNQGGTSSSRATLGEAIRGERGPFDGVFANINVGHTHVFGSSVNDARISFQNIDTTVGDPDAIIPTITVGGLAAPIGDVFLNGTRLRTYEFRDTLSLQRGAHLLRAGGEYRRIFKGISLSPPSAGTYAFNSLLDFAADKPFQQTLTVNPDTGAPTNFPRYFHINEGGLFVQDDWRISPKFTANLGLRYNYFGAPAERDGRLSSIIFGPGDDFTQRLASGSVGRVSQLYNPEKLNFSPRAGISYDIRGNGHTIIRAGDGLAYQPHHGQSIGGARALPPDAVQNVLQPNVGIGTQILYGIPVPFNPEFATGLNYHGGILTPPGKPAVRPTGFVVNPNIKTQYTETWFFSLQRQLVRSWVGELGYIGTRGVNLERIDDVNRTTGDLLDGRLDRFNPYFGPLLFVTNGVTSDYHAMTAEIRHAMTSTLSMQANYRWSKWMDTASDTSTGQFFDNPEPGKGAQNIASLKSERGRSMFDIPHRLLGMVIWAPHFSSNNRALKLAANGWQVSAIAGIQSGRPFSVWNGASFQAGGDYNADGGGGAVGGGYYDRPDAPAAGAVPSSFSKSDYLNGLFSPTVFPAPARGTNGNLGRDTFRGPHQITNDVSLARAFRVTETIRLQFRAEGFNVLNAVNLALPNSDLSLALRPDKTFSTTSAFGKSTTAFDPRVLQMSIRVSF
ncbi:MAG: TonB-dependent receptor [Bryobacteraceae bacterium]